MRGNAGARGRRGRSAPGRLDALSTALDSTQPTGTTSPSATTKTRSPGSGVTIPRPVKLPNAGSTARSAPTRNRAAARGTARPRQHDPRVQVSRQGVALLGRARLVPEHERRHEGRRVHAVDAEIVGRISGMAVVIAAHQQDLQLPAQPPASGAARPASGWRSARPWHGRDRPARPGGARRSGASACPAGPGRRRWPRPGMGMPAARKVAALPQCKSATTRVAMPRPEERPLGRAAARLARQPRSRRRRRHTRRSGSRGRPPRRKRPAASAARSSGADHPPDPVEPASPSSPARARGRPAAGTRAASAAPPRRPSCDPPAIRSSARPSRLCSSWRSSTSRCAWNSSRLSGS